MHPLVWFAWLSAAFVMTSVSRNPLYLILILVECLVLQQSTDNQENHPPTGRVPFNPLTFLLFAIPVGALFNGLTIHVGETILFRVPEKLPLIGGIITLEAIVYGAINGLFLAVLLAVFGVFNRRVAVGDMIRYVPRAFYPLAVVIAIAISYVPNTLQQYQQVREAQALRGHKMKGLHDWLPLFMPVLIGGLERAFQLAESMTARGFAGNPRHETGFGPRGLLGGTLLGLLSILAGTVLRIAGQVIASTILLVSGSLLVTAVVIIAGKQVKHTRLRRLVWRNQDWLSLFITAVCLAGFLFTSMSTRGYTIYPAVSIPSFSPISGLALLGLLIPLIMEGRDAR